MQLYDVSTLICVNAICLIRSSDRHISKATHETIQLVLSTASLVK